MADLTNFFFRDESKLARTEVEELRDRVQFLEAELKKLSRTVDVQDIRILSLEKRLATTTRVSNILIGKLDASYIDEETKALLKAKLKGEEFNG